MNIVTIKTDVALAEIGLWKDSKLINSEKWEAHRQLADTIHIKMKKLLDTQRLNWTDIGGIVVFKGPGSFTGLRIGISVANALAYTLKVPIVSESGDTWDAIGVQRLVSGDNENISLPEYGGEANITLPKK